VLVLINAIHREDVRQPSRADDYRTDIQGMRALAVGIVILAHAKIPGFSGGFVGVDIFFVLSGFLISRLLFAELAATGTIDLLGFWIKRARRLLPNALLTLAATMLLAAFVFRGYDLDRLGKEIARAGAQLVNFHFAAKSVNYFSAEDPPSPVLHFWSLSVEEQFYLVWPLLLLGLAFFSRNSVQAAGRVLVAIWCASLAAAIILTPIDQPLAYFGTGTRAWQLATGALVALHWPAIKALAPALRLGLGYLGLAAIGGSTIGFMPSMDYPGAWGLLPSLGAAGVIIAGSAGPGRIQQALSLPVLQWIGARSYSWYLWHWPLMVLPQAVYGDGPLVPLLAIPASLLIAALAYASVEDPIRRNTHLVLPSRRLVPVAALGLALTVVVGWTTYAPRTPEDPATMARRAALDKARKEEPGHERLGCFLSAKQTDQPDCLFGDVNASRRIVLIGDSHAALWFDPLDAAAKELGWRLNAWTKASCPMADVSSSRTKNNTPNHACFAWRKDIMARLTGPDRPDVVVIASRIDYTGRIYDPHTGVFPAKAEADKLWGRGFRTLVGRLVDAGVKVVVIRDVPRAYEHVQQCIIAGEPCDRPRAEAIAEPGVDVEVARSFSNGVMLADFTDVICDGDICPIMRNGMIAYRDDNHLTNGFARTFAPQFVDLLKWLEHAAPEQLLQSAAQGTADDAPSGSISPLR
jgi:peptidoglycan/LPS O-acetylase OafA/YrhL